MNITANIIVGDIFEPFLEDCLNSISPVVTDIVVVANTNNKNSYMLEHRSDIKLIYTEFKDYCTSRNIALDNSRNADYILWVDADEVHFTKLLKMFIDDVVWKNGTIGIASFYHFIKDMKHYQHIEERGILLKNNGFRWEKPVDEYAKFQPGTVGDVVHTKYQYHHYGYIKPQRQLWEGWMKRAVLLNEKDAWYITADPDTILDSRETIIYEGLYPKEVNK